MSKLLTWWSDWVADSFIQSDTVFTLTVSAKVEVYCSIGFQEQEMCRHESCYFCKSTDNNLCICVDLTERTRNKHKLGIKPNWISTQVCSHIALLMNKSKAVKCVSQPNFNQHNCLHTRKVVVLMRESTSPVCSVEYFLCASLTRVSKVNKLLFPEPLL